ncbi:MAG: hypothetical protein IKO10_04470 [Lachnospiraceae bacterium]|nr:hypothetical protein [Lachnospiraceae bacterium]
MNNIKKISKCKELIICGCLFALCLFAWFKQFTYFNYSGSEVTFDNAELTGYASTAKEKEFVLDSGYDFRLGHIIFWANRYSDIELINDSLAECIYTVSDYYGNDVEAVMEPIRLEPGGRFHFVADGRNGYVVSAYGSAPEQSIDGLYINYSNSAYMKHWKQGTVITLVMMMFFMLLFCIWSVALPESFRKAAACVCVVMGGVFLLVSEISVISLSEDTWIMLPRMLTIYLSIFAVICGQSKVGYESTDREKVLNPSFWGIICAAIALTIHFLMLTARQGSLLHIFTGGEDSGKRIAGYIVVFVIFLLLYLGLGGRKLSERLIVTLKSYFIRREALIAAILCIYALGREWFGFRLEYIIAFVAVIICIKYADKISIPPIVRKIFYCIVAILVGINSCVINMWDTGLWADVYHTGTFYHSMYFVARNEPFRGGLNQMYGHFALFYKLPMLIFGNNLLTIGVTTAVFAGIAILFVLLAMDRYFKHDVSGIIMGCMIMPYLVISELYLQTFPLRMFWSFVLIYYCACTKEKQMTWKRRLGGYLICMLAILWNPESGLVCAVSWAVCLALLSQKEVTLKKTILQMIAEMMFVVAEVAIAYSIIKAYNILTMSDGSALAEFLDWKKEMATMARENAGDTSNGKLYWTNAPWVYIEIFLMGGVTVLLERFGFFKRTELKRTDLQAMMLLLFTAGMFVYWMGRPEGYNPVAPYIACLIVVVFDRYVTKKSVKNEETEMQTHDSLQNDLIMFQHNKTFFIGICLCFVVSVYICRMPSVICDTKINLFDHAIADYSRVDSYLKNFVCEVPENTDGEAVGLRVIYLNLGWELESDGLGWGYDEADFYESAKGKKYLLVDGESVPYFRLVKSIPFGKAEYNFYENELIKGNF